MCVVLAYIIIFLSVINLVGCGNGGWSGFRVRTPPVTSSEGQIPLPQLGYTRDEHLIYTNYEVRGNKINSVCSVFILCRYKLLLVRVDVS